MKVCVATIHCTACAACAAWVALATSCAADGYEEEGTPEQEACEHAVEGPANAVDASASADDAADVTAEHTRHDVALIDGARGFVRYESEGGEHIVFMSSDVPIAFASAAGDAIAIEETRNETTCPEVVISHHVVLPVGLIDIELGPAADADVDSVALVIEHAEHAEGEE